MTALDSLAELFDRLARFAYRHRKMCLALAVFAPLTFLTWGVYDRSPPIRLFAEQGYPVPAAHRGEEVKFSFPIDRDLDRNCDLTVQRWIVDSSSERREYGPVREVSHAGIVNRELLDPDRLRIAIVVPPTLAIGRAHLLTEAAYSCSRNLTTYLWPIRMSFSWPFDVLPGPPAGAASAASASGSD